MDAYLALVCGAVFTSYGGLLVAGEGEPSWLVVGILPGGLLLFGIGILGALIPGYL